ncbi:MAG: carboxypeptidase-like regulatory domain-containing protein, partial [Bryobacteraceae bacterium]
MTAWLGCGALRAQLGLGRIEGLVRTDSGSPVALAGVIAEGSGLRLPVRTDRAGRFELALPYGRYRVSIEGEPDASAPVDVVPLQTVRVVLAITPGAPFGIERTTAAEPGEWAGDFGARVYPEGFSLASALFAREPGSVTEPLDFSGLADNRLGVISQRGFSWTDTALQFNGLDAGDDYQPGRPQILPDGDAVATTVVRSAFALTPSPAYGAEIGLFPMQAGESWHADISSAGTAGALASSNLPPPASRGAILQPEQYDWFTRDHADLGGPLSRWADIFVSGTGQWAAQAEPLAAPGVNQNSRLLFGNAVGHVRAGARDRFDALYSGSRIDLSGWGEPAGMEA